MRTPPPPPPPPLQTELAYSMSLSLMLPHGPSEGIGLHLQLSVFQVAINWWLALDTSSGSMGPLCRESVLAIMHSPASGVVILPLSIIN